jgi:nucleoside-diphosphate-sugar epimerase
MKNSAFTLGNPMQKNILVIGGTRYFGVLLVQTLLDAGHQVTLATRGRTPDPFGDKVRRIVLDRRDAHQMRDAFLTGPCYDVVFDQMCYSPLDAAIAMEVFAGKAGRYVMASTIEVYRPLLGQLERPLLESDFNHAEQEVDTSLPWHDPEFADANYGLGKRQAEAVLLRDSTMPVATVRIAHVLGGPEDFTGRLAHYVQLASQGATLRYSNEAGCSSFINPQGISAFLAWVGEQTFVGPVNAACNPPVSAPVLYRAVGEAIGVKVRVQQVPALGRGEADGQALSPFDYVAPYAMDTQRAQALGYSFGDMGAWLGALIPLHRGPAQARAAA